MTAAPGSRPYGRPSRRVVAVTVLAAAVALVCVALVVLSDRTSREPLISSPSAIERGFGLLLVAAAFPAVLATAAGLTWILRWLPAPRAVRGGLVAVTWAAATAFTAIWLLVAVVAVVTAGLTGRDVRADSELAAVPGRVAAVPDVTGAGDARLVGTDLASGHNLHVTADLDPALSRAERLRALDGISEVLAARQSNDLRMLAEARSGSVAVGVSADPRLNRYRLRVAEDVVAATGADLAVVTWHEPGDGLVHDDGTGIWSGGRSEVCTTTRISSAAAWLDTCAQAVRRRLAHVRGPAVVGHGDWWSDNVRWTGSELLAVDDWDSVVALPEAALVGAAAALHAGGGSTVDETETFLASYVAASGRTWSQDDDQVAWAAGLWSRLFDARKELAAGISSSAERLRHDVAQRADKAGL